MLGIKGLKVEMGIKSRNKATKLVAIYVRLDPNVARALIRLADQREISITRCASELISKALET